MRGALGECLIRLGRHDAAIEHLGQVLEHEPDDTHVLTNFGAFYLFTSLIMRDVQVYFFPTNSGNRPGLLGRDHSWAYELDGMAIHDGPRNLWRELEKVHALWEDHGRPDREQLGITIIEDQQSLWVGSPDQVVHTETDTGASSVSHKG